MEFLVQDNGTRTEIPDDVVAEGRAAVAAFCARATPVAAAVPAPISAPAAPAAPTPATPAAPASLTAPVAASAAASDPDRPAADEEK